MPRPGRRPLTAVAEYAVGHLGIAVVRALDRDPIGQGRRPHGPAGRVTGWVFAHRPSNRLRNAWVVALLEVSPDDRVLEIGFGPGIALARLARLIRAGSGHVYGVDHSEVMLRQASRRNAAAIRAGRVTLFDAPAERLPPGLGPFDAVLAVNSLGFWPDAADRLVELRGRLTAGGRIAVATQPRSPKATADTARRAAAEIEELLHGAGFVHIRTETLRLDPPAVCVLGTAPQAADGPDEPGSGAVPGLGLESEDSLVQLDHSAVPDEDS